MCAKVGDGQPAQNIQQPQIDLEGGPLNIKKLLPQLLQIMHGDGGPPSVDDEGNLQPPDVGTLSNLQGKFTSKNAAVDIFVVLALVARMSNAERQAGKEMTNVMEQMSWSKLQEKADKMREAADKDFMQTIVKSSAEILLKSCSVACNMKNMSSLKGANEAQVQMSRLKTAMTDSTTGAASSGVDIAAAGIKREADEIRAEMAEVERESQIFQSWAEKAKDWEGVNKKINDENAAAFDKIVAEQQKVAEAAARII